MQIQYNCSGEKSNPNCSKYVSSTNKEQLVSYLKYIEKYEMAEAFEVSNSLLIWCDDQYFLTHSGYYQWGGNKICDEGVTEINTGDKSMISIGSENSDQIMTNVEGDITGCDISINKEQFHQVQTENSFLKFIQPIFSTVVSSIITYLIMKPKTKKREKRRLVKWILIIVLATIIIYIISWIVSSYLLPLFS